VQQVWKRLAHVDRRHDLRAGLQDNVACGDMGLMSAQPALDEDAHQPYGVFGFCS